MRHLYSRHYTQSDHTLRKRQVHIPAKAAGESRPMQPPDRSVATRTRWLYKWLVLGSYFSGLIQVG